MEMEKFENTSQNFLKVSDKGVEFQNQCFDRPCVYLKGQVAPFLGEINSGMIDDPMTVVVVVSDDLSLHDFHSQYKWPLEEKGIGSDLLTPDTFMAQQVVLIQESRPFVAIFL
jgi:hypothetical protein